MQTQYVSLFSHPDTDRPDTMPDLQPGENQRSYVGLFREPADAPEDTRSAV